jgi:hypothetical protein
MAAVIAVPRHRLDLTRLKQNRKTQFVAIELQIGIPSCQAPG